MRLLVYTDKIELKSNYKFIFKIHINRSGQKKYQRAAKLTTDKEMSGQGATIA
jgi:hypothetical protein